MKNISALLVAVLYPAFVFAVFWITAFTVTVVLNLILGKKVE